MSKQTSIKQPSQGDGKLQTTDATGTGLEHATENGQRSFAAVAHLHSRVFRDAMKFNASVLDFARRRVGAEIDASDRLCQCESMTDAVTVMSDFYQAAFNDYAEQTATMLRTGTELTAVSAQETLHEASELNGLK